MKEGRGLVRSKTPLTIGYFIEIGFVLFEPRYQAKVSVADIALYSDSAEAYAATIAFKKTPPEKERWNSLRKRLSISHSLTLRYKGKPIFY